MNYRALGRTGWKISEISFGAWAIGGAWGTVDDKESLATLHAALDGGVNFFDTADVYGDAGAGCGGWQWWLRRWALRRLIFCPSKSAL